MGITKCNTMDAIWRLGLRRTDYSGGENLATNMLNSRVKCHLLSTNNM